MERGSVEHLSVLGDGVVASAVRPSTSESLVRRCASGEEQAWRDLHSAYYPIAAAFLRKLGVRDDELDDACQDVFVRVFRYLPSFRGAAELKTWLYKLCITEANQCRRRRGLLTRVRETLQREAVDEPIAVGGDMSPETARAVIEHALSWLKPDERAVFVMFEIDGLSGDEIANIVGAPVATVWRRLHYARRTFQAHVAGHAAGEP